MMGKHLRMVLALAVAALLTTVATASAEVPITTVRATAAYEYFPAHSLNILAWTQRATSATAMSKDAVMAKVGSGPPFRVNPSGTTGRTGGFGGNDGAILVFQQVTNGQSNVRFYDVLTHQYTNAPPEVNTSAREFHPTLIGSINTGFLLYGRGSGGTTRIVLTDLATHHSKVLQSSSSYLEPGQVNGPDASGNYYADWERCPALCDIHVYRFTPATFSTGTVKTYPQTENRLRYAPAVGPDGTIYYGSSGTKLGCGGSVALYERPFGGSAMLLSLFRSGFDTRHTYYDNTSGDLYFDRFRCGGDSNLYKLTPP